MSKKVRLLYIQPIFPAYRQSVVDSLNEVFDLHLAGSAGSEGREGFEFAKLPAVPVYRCDSVPLAGGRLFIQKGLISAVRRAKPDVVLVFANIRYLTYWLLLIYCRFAGIAVLSHGQGLYRKTSTSIFIKLIYRAAVSLQAKYIGYNNLSAESLINFGVRKDKVTSIANTVLLNCPSPPSSSKVAGLPVLYIGRLRSGCGVDLLIDACIRLREEGILVEVHIVGDGAQKNLLIDRAAGQSWVKFYGRIFGETEVAEIGRRCKFGCYPGDAGLSVVHYFGLSLPPIVHDSLAQHMGPEPAYVRPGINGLTFKRGDIDSLVNALRMASSLSGERYSELCRESFNTYLDLTKRSFASQLSDVISEIRRCNG